ncbi:MAG: hypothetical protein AB1679_07130 [Actinomycetota bacterium]|jgi:hypothetical protein
MSDAVGSAERNPMAGAVWALRRGFWNGLTTVKFRGNRPAVVSAPPDRERPVVPIPFRAVYPDIPINGLVVADHVPADEVTPMKRVFTAVQTALYKVFPPMQGGLPAISPDANEALSSAYPPAHRRDFRLPRRPAEYAEGPDLGRLAVASPYACYLQRTGEGQLRWDLAALDGFECQPGLRPPAAVVDFRIDESGRRLEAVSIDCDLGRSSPGDRDWQAATGLALCAVTTHLSLVRHFNWIHLVAGAQLAMATRNHLSSDHPLRRLLWPHVYGTQSSNQVVTGPQMSPGGDFEAVFSYTHRGMCDLFEAMCGDFDLGMIEPDVDAGRRGVLAAGFDTPALDNRRQLMDVLLAHTRRYLDAYYPDEDSLAADGEFGDWLAAMDRDLPHGVGAITAGAVSVDGAARLLATLIYLVTVEHEIVGSGLWDYQLWSDVHPVRVYRDGSRPPLDVYLRLVNGDFILNVHRMLLMTDFSELAVDLRGAEAFRAFLRDLRGLQAELDRQPAACWRMEPKMLKANINA